MSHRKKTKGKGSYEVSNYLWKINYGNGDLRVQSLIKKEMDFVVYLLFWKNNRLLNLINHFRFSKMSTRDKLLYSQNFVENIVPLDILRNLSKIYPESLMKEMISENKDLTFISLGFIYSYVMEIMEYYINNYSSLKKKFKNQKKLSSNEKEKALLKLVDKLYKEST